MKPKDKPKKGQWWEDVGPKEVRALLEKYHGIVAAVPLPFDFYNSS